MRKFVILALLGLFVSCDWFMSKEVKTQKLVDQEMQSIDWNELDEYPLFDNCDETDSKTVQKECFETTLLSHFSSTLHEFDFELDAEINDTVYVDFIMDKEGWISVLKIDKNAAVNSQIPEFNAIITRSLKNLPKVAPALKRGIPVSAKFRIPIVLNTK